MSQIVYNGVELQIVRTHTFRQESVYDRSDTDMMRMRFTVGVQAVVSIAATSFSQIAPALVGENPVATMNRIRHMLAAPRRPFTMSVAGQTLLQVQTAPDAANGPKPRLLTITRIADTMFLIDWQCEVNLVECDNNGTPPPYVSLRWSQSVRYDRRWYATVRTAGALVVNSSLLINPDSLRAIVTPPIPDGFQRMPARYVLSEDGLRLSFAFDDVQAFHLPLYPALRCTGKAGVVTGQGAGPPARHLFINVRMEGGPTTLKSDMVIAAMSVFLSYAGAAGGLYVSQSSYLFQGGVTCDMWDNVIELQASARLNPADKQNWLAVNAGFVDVNPNAQASGVGGADLPEPGIAPPLQGQSEFLGLVAAAFNDMCLAGARPPSQGSAAAFGWAWTNGSSDGNDSPQAVPGGSQSSLTLGAVDIDPDPADFYADSLPGVYEFYRIHNSYKTHRNQAILAPASSSATALIAVVALAKPVLTLVSCWTAEKVGGPPEIPPSDPPDGNTVLLDTLIEPEEIQAAQDLGELRYTISGRYEFVFLDASQVDPTRVPIPPYLAGQIAEQIQDFSDAQEQTLWGAAVADSIAGNPGSNP